jgi:hypothetical protein
MRQASILVDGYNKTDSVKTNVWSSPFAVMG